MTDLAELLERVKAATGPDREIDALIAKALLSEAHPRLDPTERLCAKGDLSQPLCWRRAEPMRADMRRRKEADGAEVLELQDERGWWLFVSRCVPPVTASLDSALALMERVLPGWAWSVGNLRNSAQCYLMHRGRPLIGPGLAHTPPLAVLVALLSALIAQAAETAVGSASLTRDA